MLFIYSGNDEIYGYAGWLYSIATLLIPMATGGLLSLLVKYFPSYNTDDSGNYNGLLSLVSLGLIAAFGIFVILWFLFIDEFIRFLEFVHVPNAGIIKQYQYFILGLVALLIMLRFLIGQSINSLRTVVPDIVEKLGYKIWLPTLVLAFAYFQLSKEVFSYGILLFFGLACVLMVIYLRSIGTLRFGKIKKPLEGDSYKSMGKFAAFGSLNLIGLNLASRLDNIMIPLYLNMAQNGFFTKASFLSNILDFPTRSLNQIAAPIISKAWKDNHLEEIDVIYKKASVNLFLIGCLVFLLIWYSLDDVISLSTSPDTFHNARAIFLILAISKLADMITSVNTQILIYSKAYRYSLYFLLFLGIANVALNSQLIPQYGIVGAAAATAISLIAFNIMKLVFIYRRYNMHPFSIANLKTLVLLGIFVGFYFVIPSSDISFLNIAYKSTFVGLSYLALAYYWRISADANELGLTLINRILERIK